MTTTFLFIFGVLLLAYIIGHVCYCYLQSIPIIPKQEKEPNLVSVLDYDPEKTAKMLREERKRQHQVMKDVCKFIEKLYLGSGIKDKVVVSVKSGAKIEIQGFSDGIDIEIFSKPSSWGVSIYKSYATWGRYDDAYIYKDKIAEFINLVNNHNLLEHFVAELEKREKAAMSMSNEFDKAENRLGIIEKLRKDNISL